MKTTLQLCLLLLSTLISNATILRCNNNPGVTGTYQTLYDALSNASPGDTIHLEPSSISYGFIGGFSNPSISVNNITFIGNGLNLSANPGNQADTLISKIDYFFSGGDYNSFYGIECLGPMFIAGDYNIIENCKFKYLRFYSHHCLLNHCIIPTRLTGSLNDIIVPNVLLSWSAHDIEISNSYFGGAIYSDSNSSYNISLINNVFDDTLMNSLDDPLKLFNATLINNVFKSDANVLDTSGNNIFINNIALSNSCILPSGNGNISGVNPNIVFANPESAQIEDQHILPTFSVQNVGLFAGADPYIPGRSGPIPSISDLIVPNVIQTNSGTITISTRSNQ